MTGFIGTLQLIIFLGILYVVAADELIDNKLSLVNARFARALRVLLLPSYVGMTLLGIWWIIPYPSRFLQAPLAGCQRPLDAADIDGHHRDRAGGQPADPAEAE